MTKALTLRMDDELYKKIKSLAEEDDRTICGMIFHLLKESIRNGNY